MQCHTVSPALTQFFIIFRTELFYFWLTQHVLVVLLRLTSLLLGL